MGDEHDHAVLPARVADDEVAHDHGADRRRTRRELVCLEVAGGNLRLEMILDEGLGGQVAGRTDIAPGRRLDHLSGQCQRRLSADTSGSPLRRARQREDAGKHKQQGGRSRDREAQRRGHGDHAAVSLPLAVFAGFTMKAAATPRK